MVASGHTDRPLTVLTRAVPPFAFQDDAGRWRGIAIELWEQIAADLALRYEYEAVSLPDMLARLERGEADAAEAALSVTAAREEKFDFSHPYHHSGLGIAVRRDTAGGDWRDTLRGLASPRFLRVVAALLLLLTLVGALVWWLEGRHNAHFPKQPLPGIGSWLWWSSVTMTTVGYGDKAPVSFWGRAVALVWMFASVILISTVTASLTTAFTVDALATHVQGEGHARCALERAAAGLPGRRTMTTLARVAAATLLADAAPGAAGAGHRVRGGLADVVARTPAP